MIFFMIELDPNILDFKNIGNGRALYKILIESEQENLLETWVYYSK